MVKWKIGDEISDEDGWRSVDSIDDDGMVYFVDQDGGEHSVIYSKDNDKSLEKYDRRGFVVKITGNPKFTAYTPYYFDSKVVAKKFAEREVKKAKPRKLYYRVEETIIRRCPRCHRDQAKSDGDTCFYCEKMRDV